MPGRIFIDCFTVPRNPFLTNWLPSPRRQDGAILARRVIRSLFFLTAQWTERRRQEILLLLVVKKLAKSFEDILRQNLPKENGKTSG